MTQDFSFRMSAAKLCEFFEKEIQDCFDNGEHLNGITSFLLPSIGWSVRQSFFLILGISVTLKKLVNIYALIFLGLMMSLHMKATMMKVSDPIIFGHCVKVYFKVGAHFCTMFLVGSETTFGLRTLY